MWFDGKVADAICKAKAEHNLLLVFICGNDDEGSAVMSHHFDDLGIVSLCQNAPLVCIKIPAKSNMAAQFGAIYPLPTVPMLYIIGIDGLPLEIIAGQCEKNQMITKIENVVKKFSEDIPAGSSNVQVQPNQITAEGPIPIQEKVDRAQELLEIRRHEKEAEAKELEKEEEIKRREMGKKMQEMEAERAEKERKELAQERKKKKLDDKEALAKIKMQIAQDRADKQRRFETGKEMEEEELQAIKKEKERIRVEEGNALIAARSNEARIQFRLPNGRSLANRFNSDSILQEAYDFIAPHVIEHGNFQLRQMLPRREFTTEDMNRSFRTLQLAPTAVIIIIPESGKLVSHSSLGSGGSWFASIWAILSAPFFFMYSIFASFFGLNPRITNNERKRSTDRKQVGGLNSAGTSDKNKDDNATWNGNSTQQL